MRKTVTKREAAPEFDLGDELFRLVGERLTVEVPKPICVVYIEQLATKTLTRSANADTV